jgi:hypothetical protein
MTTAVPFETGYELDYYPPVTRCISSIRRFLLRRHRMAPSASMNEPAPATNRIHTTRPGCRSRP